MIDTNSVTDRIKILELISCPVNITGLNLFKTLKYTNDYSVTMPMCFVGDSILEPVVALFTANTHYNFTSIANSGDKSEDQELLWDALNVTVKQSFRYVFVEVGINDLIFTVAQFQTKYQSLIDKIRSEISTSCKIISFTLTPARQYWVDAGGEAYGEAVYQKWLTFNEAIRGDGANAITGIDTISQDNTNDLNDGLGNLQSPYYDEGDHLHPNAAGTEVIYDNITPYII